MAEVTNQMSSMFNLYKLKPSAALLVVRKVVALLVAHSAQQALIDRGKATIAKLTQAMEKNFNWQQRKLGKTETKARAGKTDAQLDRAVSNLLKLLEIFKDMPPSDPRHDMAVRIIDDLFPEGVFGITSARYEEELGKVQTLINHLETRYPNEVNELGLQTHIDRLKEVAADFADALNYLDAAPLTYDEVLAVNTEADEEYHKFIVAVLAAFLDDDAQRATIIQPILNQNRWTGQYFKRRGTSPEVDPDTGEPLDGDVPPPPEDVDVDIDVDVDTDTDAGGGEQPVDEDIDTPGGDPVPSE